MSAQGTIKFEYYGRYDTALTNSDTALFKMTLIEFHRKIALAGYATFYRRDPTVLAKYVDVAAESIMVVSDSERMVILNEIATEIELARTPATFSRIALRQIRFVADTVAELSGVSPFLSGETEEGASADVKYTLHRIPNTAQWWVFKTVSAEGEITYRNYLGLPDEPIIEEER